VQIGAISGGKQSTGAKAQQLAAARFCATKAQYLWDRARRSLAGLE
jgi:hypothetical protein